MNVNVWPSGKFFFLAQRRRATFASAEGRKESITDEEMAAAFGKQLKMSSKMASLFNIVRREKKPEAPKGARKSHRNSERFSRKSHRDSGPKRFSVADLVEKI